MPVDSHARGVEPAQRKRFSCQFFEGVCNDDLVLVDELVAAEFPTVVEGDQSGDLGVAASYECGCADLNCSSTPNIPRHNSSSLCQTDTSRRGGAWVQNLRANPAAHIEIGTESFDAVARELPPAEDDIIPKITEIAPIFAEYQAKTSRVIPIFDLQKA